MYFAFLDLFGLEDKTMIMIILIFLFMNLLVIFNSYIILKNFEFAVPEDNFLAIGVITMSQIVLTLLFLGLMKMLCVENVIILSLLIAMGLSILNVFRLRYVFFVNLFSDFKSLQQFILNKIKGFKELDIPLGISFLLLTFTIFLIIIVGILKPTYGHDDLLYHLPMAVSWLKARSVYLVQLTSFSDINIALHYPGNFELFLLWNLLPFNDDIIADLSQLIFAILGAVACYGIARKSKIKKKYAAWAPILFLLTPIVILQTKTTYNDVVFASMFLISLNFLLSYKENNKTSCLILSALSFGFTFGTKYLGITYFLVYILFFLLLHPKKKISKILPDFLIIVLFIFLIGGFWYVRNFMERGSVIYPMRIELFGHIIMNAPYNPITMYSWLKYKYVSREWEWLVYPFLEAVRGYSFEVGFGPQFISLMVPSIFLIFLCFFARDRNMLFLLFPILILLFFLSPVKEPRYFITLLGVGSVAVSYCISRIEHPKIIETIALACVIFSIFNSLPQLFICNFNILEIQNNYDFWACTYHSYADGWKWLNEHTNGDNIVGITHFLYPLYGEKFKNNIVFIPPENYNSWVSLLKENKIKYLVIAPTDYNYSVREYDFIKKLNPKLVYEKEMISIYLIEL